MRALYAVAIAVASLAVGVVPAAIPASSSASSQHTSAGCPAHPADLEGQSLIQADIGTGSGSLNSLPGGLACANLRNADLTQAELKGADLHGADLSGAQLGQAELTGADLQGADLDHADLTQAELGNTNLRGANLAHAGLSQATVTGADLRDADLDYADLTQADIGQADLRGASLWLTTSIQAFSITDAKIDTFGHGDFQLSYILLPGAVVLLLFRWGRAAIRSRRSLAPPLAWTCGATLLAVVGTYAFICGVGRLFLYVGFAPLWAVIPGPIAIPGLPGMFAQAAIGAVVWAVGRTLLTRLSRQSPPAAALPVDAVF